MNYKESLSDKVESLEGAITCNPNAQDIETSRITAEIPVDINALGEEPVRRCEVVDTKRAERGERVAALCEENRERLDDLGGELVDAKHEPAVIHSPILFLPYEVTAEIFDWHMLMHQSVKTMLLVCKQWTIVAYSRPRLWSRIAFINCRCHEVILQGALRYDTVHYLRSVLSRTKASPLQVELCVGGYCDVTKKNLSPESIANHEEAIGLILDNKILRKCTHFVLGCPDACYTFPGWLTMVENTTILPLLPSLYIGLWFASYFGCAIFRSFIKFSPSLRHIRIIHDTRDHEDYDLGVWQSI